MRAREELVWVGFDGWFEMILGNVLGKYYGTRSGSSPPSAALNIADPVRCAVDPFAVRILDAIIAEGGANAATALMLKGRVAER